MERIVTINIAKTLFGNNFICEEDIINKIPFIDGASLIDVPPIPYEYTLLDKCKDDYLLILGANTMKDNKPTTLLNLRTFFGINPDKSEPCFYNQDWYLNEDFINISISNNWYLIRKNVYEDSRAVLPGTLCTKYNFPSAIQCAYAFFVFWYCRKEILWKNDFVWCRDKDHNGDRIYVGKYQDLDGVNKNGFSIHRHLALRNCYAATVVI